MPDNNKTYFVVTVDTEADDAWSKPETIALRNLSALPRFQDLCNAYNILPTYLITYECAARDEAVSILKPLHDKGVCEIGHHLHSWTTPPFQKEDPPGIDCAWLHAYQSELPDTLFREKANVLYEAIEDSYGIRPTSHRAGRWGIDQRTIRWLIDNKFLVDTSVVPLRNFSKNQGKNRGGPDFYSEPRIPHPWTLDDGRYLMEIPVTVDVPPVPLVRLCAYWLSKGFVGSSLVERLFRRRGGAGVFRPDPKYPAGLLTSFFHRSMQSNHTVMNFMIHSSELVLGCSPYSRTGEDLTSVWRRIEEVFEAVNRLGIKPSKLSEAAALV